MTGTNICVVDDDRSVLLSLKELLTSDGFEAEMFGDPEEFLVYVGANPVRLAILDLWMPELNGLELQGQLQRVSPQTRVIIITGRPESTTQAAALDAGAFAFFSKPVDNEVFLSSVRGALGE
jgi:FixJ family two-component response regulator